MHLADAVASDPLHMSADSTAENQQHLLLRNHHPGLYVDSVSTCAGVTMSLAGDTPSTFTAGLGVVLGPHEIQLLVMVVGLLPWVMSCAANPAHSHLASTCADLLAAAAMAQGHKDLADGIWNLAGDLSMDREALMDQVCSLYSSSLALLCAIKRQGRGRAESELEMEWGRRKFDGHTLPVHEAHNGL